MFNPRNGQWVKFHVDNAGELENFGAWKSPDGMFVGIFQRGGFDAMGNQQPGGIHVVAESGDTLLVLQKVEGQMVQRSVSLDPSTVNDLQPLLDVHDIPPGRQFSPEWKPTA
jgi:hypothetical protein